MNSDFGGRIASSAVLNEKARYETYKYFYFIILKCIIVKTGIKENIRKLSISYIYNQREFHRSRFNL